MALSSPLHRYSSEQGEDWPGASTSSSQIQEWKTEHVWSLIPMASKLPSPKILHCFNGPNSVITQCHCCDLKLTGVINPSEYKIKKWCLAHKSYWTALLQGEMRHPESSNHANI